MNFLESSEDYLEAILVLSKQQPNVRSIDVANKLNFSKPSVSIAMKKLIDKELITIDDKGYIHLLDKGSEIASRIYERHCILYEALKSVGVPEKLAYEDACKIEHDLSEETFECIKKLVRK